MISEKDSIKLTESHLKKLIKEALLTELFDAPPYGFKIFMKNVSTPESSARAHASGKRILDQRVSYGFASNDYDYSASLMLKHYGPFAPNPSGRERVYQGQPAEDDDLSSFYYWDITFSADELDGDDMAGFSMKMTNQNDMRVLSTIAAIVKNFAIEVLPTLVDSNVKTFSFEGIQEGTRDPETGQVLAWHKGDPEGSATRRTRIYTSMLKRKLPAEAKIIPTPSNVLDPVNTLFFRLP